MSAERCYGVRSWWKVSRALQDLDRLISVCMALEAVRGDRSVRAQWDARGRDAVELELAAVKPRSKLGELTMRLELARELLVPKARTWTSSARRFFDSAEPG